FLQPHEEGPLDPAERDVPLVLRRPSRRPKPEGTGPERNRVLEPVGEAVDHQGADAAVMAAGFAAHDRDLRAGAGRGAGVRGPWRPELAEREAVPLPQGLPEGGVRRRIDVPGVHGKALDGVRGGAGTSQMALAGYRVVPWL